MVLENPTALQTLSCRACAANYNQLHTQYLKLHDKLFTDVILELHVRGMFNCSARELSQSPAALRKLLKQRHQRMKWHYAFQATKDHGSTDILADLSRTLLTPLEQIESSLINLPDVQLASDVGDFLTEAGWYMQAEKIYTATLLIFQMRPDTESIYSALYCCSRLLKVHNAYCRYENACAMVECSRDMLMELQPTIRCRFNKASLYTEMAVLLFAKSNHNEAFKHSIFALRELLKPSVTQSDIVDVLRLCAKACIARHHFKLAEKLITLAVKSAWIYFGKNHLKYSDALLDYGFYLLSVDRISDAVTIYEDVLRIRRLVFNQGYNSQIAMGLVELAFSQYVKEYSSGNFDKALSDVNEAIRLFEKILPDHNHLLLSTADRVKALILEEMAINMTDEEESMPLLTDAFTLHINSLRLALREFGERNLLTAKHYGNLGRLYQTFCSYEEAEKMHKKAIAIKEDLLGDDHYEVAVSLGHLASLYAFDMWEYGKAEELYLRSVAVYKRLFGPNYSGLKYDYRGLMKIYTATDQQEKVDHYVNLLNDIMAHWETVEPDPKHVYAFLEDEQLTLSLIPSLLEGCVERIPDVSSLDNHPSLLELPSLPCRWSEVPAKSTTDVCETGATTSTSVTASEVSASAAGTGSSSAILEHIHIPYPI